MRILLCAIAIIVCLCGASESEQCRAERVGAVLIQANHLGGYHFRVFGSHALNAMTYSNNIELTSSLVEFLVSDDELACILGHELSHAERDAKEDKMRFALKSIHGWRDYAILMSPEENEFTADAQGVTYAFRAGYKPSAFVSFLRRYPSAVKLIPTNEERARRIEKVILKLNHE